jgi:hypothetical protein
MMKTYMRPMNGAISMLFLLLSGLSRAAVVTVSGRQLLVDGTPFTVRGVNYSPVPVGQHPNTYDWSANPDTYLADLPYLGGLGVNAIRTYGPVTQQAALDAMWSRGIYVIMGFNIPTNADITGASTRTALINDFVNMVNQWKGHPAVLMWSFGNEVTLSNTFARLNDTNRTAWYSLANQAAQAAQAADPAHPVTTVNAGIGEINVGSMGTTDAQMPDLDLWGVNIYQGTNFGANFTNYATRSAKPLILMEFGCDAYNASSALGGTGERQDIQNLTISGQWTNLSTPSQFSAAASTNVLVGAVVFEYSDEWWKYPAGDQGAHNTQTGWINSFYSDSTMQEEWWGLVSIAPGTNIRTARTAYNTLATRWGGVGAPATDPVLNVYSDKGIGGTEVQVWDGPTWSPPVSDGAIFNGANTTLLNVPEGREVFSTTHFDAAGWGIFFDSARNLNAYRGDFTSGGMIRFWLYTNTSNMKVEAQLWNGTTIGLANNLTSAPRVSYPGKPVLPLNTWVPIEIIPPSAPTDLSAVKSPFMITANTAGTFYVDKVRWVMNRGVSLNASVRSRATGSVAPGPDLTFNVTGPQWVTADQFVRVDLDSGNNRAWGLQIYTDNRGSAASPAYTGPVDSNPAGLVDMANTTRRVPLVWHASDVLTSDVNIVTQDAYGNPVTSGGRQYHWLKDLSTPSLPMENTNSFTNGEDAVTAWDEEGYHFAPGGKTGPYWGLSWGAVRSPLYLYVAAPFGSALTGTTYRTTALILEYFSE